MIVVGEAVPALPAPLKPLPFLLSSCRMPPLLQLKRKNKSVERNSPETVVSFKQQLPGSVAQKL